MNKKFIIIVIAVLLSTICWANNDMIVKNLTVEDNPFDYGAGLILRFEPLPRSARIIEYRFYRGITPDSLFYIGSLDVNPKADLTSTDLTFYDKDFRPFVDIDSPKKLRHEKGYKPGSPIFRAIPRDVSIVGPMIQNFESLAIIGKNNFFKKTQKYLIEQEDGSTDVLGGLKIVDFETILANVLPGKKYYYTVIAVDHRRTYHPHAPIVYGIPSDDMPEPVENLYIKWINDLQLLNVEFDYPLFVDDIAQASVYIINRDQMNDFGNYRDYMEELDKWNRAVTIGDTLAVMPEPVNNPGNVIATIPTSFPYTSINFAQIKYEDGYLINETDGSTVPFNIDDVKQHVFYVTMDDYFGFQALSTLVIAETANSTLLPSLPEFEVRDKPYDKGDANELIVGLPLAQLTRADFRSIRHDKRRLSFAYSYSENPNIKVKSIKFDFVDINGNHLRTVTEHYIDNTFHLNLPDERYFDEGFKVYISFNAPGHDIHQVPYLSQMIQYSDDLMMLKPGNLLQDGEEMLNYRYQIVKRALYDRNFRNSGKVTPMINLYDDYIQYELYMFRGIAAYDVQQNHLLFDPIVDMGNDLELGSPVYTNLFLDDFVNNLNAGIADAKEKLEENPDDQEIMASLEFFQTFLDMQTQHPYLAEINQISNQKQKNIALMNLREKHRRTFEYYMFKTNNEALFAISDIYTDFDGNSFFVPNPNWFNKNNIPTLVATLIFGILVFYCFRLTKSGKDLFVRPIAGIEEIDNAIGRATEMGKPMLFVPGLSSIDDVATLAGLSILSHITKKAALYDTKIIVPCTDYIVLPIAQQIVKEAYSIAGRQDSYDVNDVFFVSGEQFAYVAGVNGIMIRQKTATNFYMGYFFAEALVMTETGNMTGAVQVAGTDAITQIPFFITTCDYTLIGEELYAASAYLSRDPMIMGTLKSQDYTKLIIIVCIFIGTILSTINVTGLINWFPAE